MAKYRKYSKEFQLQAARLVTEQGYSYQNAAKRLGTTTWSIRNWVQKFRQNGELPAQNETQPKADELRQLRKEIVQLRMENDILKKAAAYFAKESL
jgi:transposase-like protein